MGSLSPVTTQTQGQKQKQTQNKETQFSLNIVSMVNDYTLVNKVLEPFLNINTEHTTFSLKEFKERETRNSKKGTINVLNDWISYFTTGTGINIETDSFETRVQNQVDLLNHAIINATDGLLNMCDKMIAKTTSSLPLSYSSYALFETEMRLKNVNLDHDDSDDSNSNKKDSGMFGFFSSSSSKTSSSKDVAKVDISKDMSKSDIEDDVIQQMYDYHSYRLALNNRQTFLNGLCFNTFGIPYTLNYDSVDNILTYTFNPAPLNYYMIIVQNIIDNSFVKNLNRGFKDQQKGKGEKNKNKNKDDFNFDVEFDIDKDKKDSLVEKAKYILPILQKLEQRLPTYLLDVAKRSINVDEYFQNLRQFWTNVLDESIIASHDNPLKYKQELEILKKKAEEALKSRQKVEQQEKDNLLNAEQEAQRIKDEYKKKVLIEEARDFVRQGEILFKERQHNFSKQEWAQINVWFSYQFTKVVDIYESTLGGIGQLLDSTLSVPTNIVVNFTSTQISQIGKLLVLIGGVVIIGLMTMFLVKLFIRKVINLLGFGEKQV
jgi:hypothetical protein